MHTRKEHIEKRALRPRGPRKKRSERGGLDEALDWSGGGPHSHRRGHQGDSRRAGELDRNPEEMRHAGSIANESEVKKALSWFEVICRWEEEYYQTDVGYDRHAGRSRKESTPGLKNQPSGIPTSYLFADDQLKGPEGAAGKGQILVGPKVKI